MPGEALCKLSYREKMPGDATVFAAGQGGWQRGEVGTDCLGKRHRSRRTGCWESSSFAVLVATKVGGPGVTG